MSKGIPAQIAALDDQIATLQLRKAQLEQEAATPWPKRQLMYAYCSKERHYSIGETLGLIGEALSLFGHFEEIELEVEVAADGTVTIVGCDGTPLQR